MATVLPRADRPPVNRLLARAAAFVAAPASPRPLAVLRIGLALVLLAQALAVAGSLPALYGPHGLAYWEVTESTVPAGVPRVGWLADAPAPLGVDADTALRLTFLAYVAGLVYLLLGWRTRPAAAVAWLTHVALNAAGSATTYGVDQIADIALFYCVWMPVGEAVSVDRWLGRALGTPAPAARVALRVLQIHLCIIYLASGLEKASGTDWWTGEAMWRALVVPDPGRLDFAWLADVPWLAVLACWATLVIEIGYIIMVWPGQTRKLWVLATVGLHVGIGLLMGLVSFAALMIVLNGAAFLVPTRGARCLAGGAQKQEECG
jgi:hypothetical protein